MLREAQVANSQAISEGGKSTKGTGDKRIFRAHNVLGMGVRELKELQE